MRYDWSYFFQTFKLIVSVNSVIVINLMLAQKDHIKLRMLYYPDDKIAKITF